MTTLTLGPLAQIARTVRDIKESEAWYGATLGLPHLYTFGSLWWDAADAQRAGKARP